MKSPKDYKKQKSCNNGMIIQHSLSPSRTLTHVSAAGGNSSQGNDGMVVNVNTAVDSRVFQIITLPKMTAKNFQEMIPLLQAGQNIRHYCDADAESLIYIHLETLRLRDKSFKVNKDSPLREIFEAMKLYHQTG